MSCQIAYGSFLAAKQTQNAELMEKTAFNFLCHCRTEKNSGKTFAMGFRNSQRVNMDLEGLSCQSQ